MSNSIIGRSTGFVALSAVAAGFALSATAQAGANGEVSIPLNDIGCTEFNRFENLTPNDTLTLITSAHNPEQELGYAIVYAVDAAGDAVSANYLVGQQMSINGIEAFEYSINPVDFRAIAEAGSSTDVDGDDIRDLDGAEYELLPDELLVPRFIAQGSGMPEQELNGGGGYHGRLILLDLNSGDDFDTTVDFLTYNDNEEVFSGEYTFSCWAKPRLVDISGVFRDNFLKNSTNHSPNESVGGREAGWFKFWGHVANSTAATIAAPGIYGVYIEQVGPYAAADLPFELGTRDGHILPRSIFGDNSEGGGLAGDADPVVRRRPGSLLVFPEFDNLQGHMTLYTVTNTSSTEDVRAHFIYYGKYAN